MGMLVVVGISVVLFRPQSVQSTGDGSSAIGLYAQTSDTVGLLKFYDGKKKYCLGYDPKGYVKAIENCAPCLEGSCFPKPYLHWVLTGKGKQARIKALPFENTRNHMSRPQCLQRSGLGEGEP